MRESILHFTHTLVTLGTLAGEWARGMTRALLVVRTLIGNTHPEPHQVFDAEVDNAHVLDPIEHRMLNHLRTLERNQ